MAPNLKLIRSTVRTRGRGVARRAFPQCKSLRTRCSTHASMHIFFSLQNLFEICLFFDMLALWLSCVLAAPSADEIHVDCTNSVVGGAVGDGSAARPFASPAQALLAIRARRIRHRETESHTESRNAFHARRTVFKQPVSASSENLLQRQLTVNVAGWCELATPLVLDNPSLDSNVAWVGSGPGAGLSGGVQLAAADTNTKNKTQVTEVDLQVRRAPLLSP